MELIRRKGGYTVYIQSVDQLAGFFLVARVVGWLIVQFVGQMVGWLVGQLFSQMVIYTFIQMESYHRLDTQLGFVFKPYMYGFRGKKFFEMAYTDTENGM